MMSAETKERLNNVLEKGVSLNTSACGLNYLAKQACDFLNKNFNNEGIYAELHSQASLDLYHVLKTDRVATIIFDELGISFSEDTTAENFALVTLQVKDMIIYMKNLVLN